MERATKEVQIGEHTLTFYTYATGREFNAIQEVYLNGAKVNAINGNVTLEGFNPNADNEAMAKAIGLLVKLFDGSAEDVTNKVMDLPYADYTVVVGLLNELTGKKNSQK